MRLLSPNPRAFRAAALVILSVTLTIPATAASAAPTAHPDVTAAPAPPPVRPAPDEITPGSEAGSSSGFYLPAPELVLRGERLLDEPGSLSVDAAEEKFKSALTVEPGCGPALAGMARVTVIRYQRRWIEDDALIDTALDFARKSVVSSPDDPRSHAALALASLVAEEGATAQDEADRAWSLRGPQTPPWVHEAYAQALIARGEFKEAVRVLQDLRVMQPARFQSWHLEGNARLEMSNLDEALLCFRRANLLATDFPATLLQMAVTFERQGRRDFASQLYDQVLKRFPEEKGRVFLRMAASLIGRGKYAEAIDGLDQITFRTKRGLGEGTVIYLKALCLDKLRRPDDAAALYRKVIDEYPLASYGAVTAESLASLSYEALARISLAVGRQEEAVRLLEEALTRQRPTLGLFTGLARVYSDYNLHAEAIQVLKRGSAIDFGPRRTVQKANLYVAWAREANQSPGVEADRAEILKALDRDSGAIRERGDFPDYLEVVRACVLAGDNARALVWLKLAVDRGYRRLDWVDGDAEMAPLSREKDFVALRRALPAP